MTQEDTLWLVILLACTLTMGIWIGIRIGQHRALQRLFDYMGENPDVCDLINSKRPKDLPRR